MRIISKTRDYYDSVQSFGFDDSVIYHRVQKEEEIDIGEEAYKHKVQLVSNNWTNDYRFTSRIIGFCGKQYPALRAYFSLCETKKYFYSAEEFFLFLKGHKKKTAQHAMLQRIEADKGYKGHWGSKRLPLKEAIEEFFKQPFNQPQITELYSKHNTPCFLIRPMSRYDRRRFGNSRILRINPVLKDINFYHVVDTYQAYQEIEMFISGVLGNTGNEMATISDEKMRDKKGFNCWSFKKKGKNSKRKCPK